jgi:hypothetical protein
MLTISRAGQLDENSNADLPPLDSVPARNAA